MRNSIIRCLAVCLLATSPAAADEKVYNKAIPSTVLIVTPDGIGSGVLVDLPRRLVVTANHVPGKHNIVAVAFPEFDRAGRPISAADHYLKKTELIRGKVLDRRPTCDLALVQIDTVPTQARGMALSDGAREAGAIHVIGNSNADYGGLFGCVCGHVRNVFDNTPSAKNPLAGRVVLASVAANHGDSGGPVVNDAGELVAIISARPPAKEGAQAVVFCPEVSEVRALLDANRPVKPWEAANRRGTWLATDAAIAVWERQSATPRLFSPDLLKPVSGR